MGPWDPWGPMGTHRAHVAHGTHGTHEIHGAQGVEGNFAIVFYTRNQTEVLSSFPRIKVFCRPLRRKTSMKIKSALLLVCTDTFGGGAKGQ